MIQKQNQEPNEPFMNHEPADQLLQWLTTALNILHHNIKGSQGHINTREMIIKRKEV